MQKPNLNVIINEVKKNAKKLKECSSPRKRREERQMKQQWAMQYTVTEIRAGREVV